MRLSSYNRSAFLWGSMTNVLSHVGKNVDLF